MLRIWLKLSLTAKLILITVVMIAVISSSVGVFLYKHLNETLTQKIHAQLTSSLKLRQQLLLNLVRHNLQRFILLNGHTNIRHSLEDYLSTNQSLAKSQKEIIPFLLDIGFFNKDVKTIWITDLKGNTIVSSKTELQTRDWSDLPEFISGKKENFFTAPFLEDGKWHTIISGPLTTNMGKPMGVLFIKSDIDGPLRTLLGPNAAEEFTRFYLADFSDSEEKFFGFSYGEDKKLDLPPAFMDLLRSASIGKTNLEKINLNQNESYLGAFIPVGYRKWGMLAVVDKERAYSPLVEMRWKVFQYSSFVLMIGLGLAILVGSYLTKVFNRLTKKSLELAKGNLAVEESAEGTDEIGNLGHSFNVMVHGIQETYQNLEKTAEEWKQFVFLIVNDLKDPVRVIKIYLQLFQKDLGQKDFDKNIQVDPNRYISKAIESATHAQDLLTDLISYLELATESNSAPLVEVDSKEALTKAIEHLDEIVINSGMLIQMANLPVVQTNQTFLIKLFESLLIYTIKRQSKNEPPMIKTGAIRKKDSWLFYFKVKGLMADKNANPDGVLLHGPRSNSDSEISKRGVNLAIISKIIELCGGKMWTEREVDNTDTIYFTLLPSSTETKLQSTLQDLSNKSNRLAIAPLSTHCAGQLEKAH